MAVDFIYCVDYPAITPGEAIKSTHIAGWCLSSEHIHSIRAITPSGIETGVDYGGKRPDVAKVFNQFPNREKCAFSIDLKRIAEPLTSLTLILTVTRAKKLLTYSVRIELTSNDIQHALSEPADNRGDLPAVSSKEMDSLLKKSLGDKPGITLRLDIINKCNLRCIMCHYQDDGIFKRPAEKMTLDAFRKLFDTISPFVKAVMLSCGDEPLLSEHFSSIVSYISSKTPPIEISFCTNAMLLDDKIRRLSIEKGIIHTLFSMDGCTRKTYESIRTGAKYDRIVANIFALKEMKKSSNSKYPLLIVNYVMMNSNIHEAPVFVKLCSLLDIQTIDFRHVVPSAYFNNSSEFLEHHKAKYNYYHEMIMNEGARHDLNIIIPEKYDTSETWIPHDVPEVTLDDFHGVKCDVPENNAVIPKEYPEHFSPENNSETAVAEFSGAFCERPFSEIMIVQNDIVLPCPWYKRPLGKLSEGKSLNDIFFGDNFRQVRKNMLKPEGDAYCVDCPIKSKYLPTQ